MPRSKFKHSNVLSLFLTTLPLAASLTMSCAGGAGSGGSQPDGGSAITADPPGAGGSAGSASKQDPGATGGSTAPTSSTGHGSGAPSSQGGAPGTGGATTVAGTGGSAGTVTPTPTTGTGGTTPPAAGTGGATPPAAGTDGATPPAAGTGGATPPAVGTGGATPPAVGTGGTPTPPPATGGANGTGGISGTGGTPVVTPPPSGSQTKYVFVVAMENESSKSVYGSSDAPYLNGLIAKYAHATAFNDPLSDSIPSEPHYVWMEAGTNQFSDRTFTDDSDPSASNSTKSTAHLVTQMAAASPPISWMSYPEGLSSGTGACPVHSSGFYAAKHDPFVFFQDSAGSPPSATNAACAAHHQAYTRPPSVRRWLRARSVSTTSSSPTSATTCTAARVAPRPT